jgi:hypothetical protein
MDTNKYLIDLSDSNRTDFGYVAFAMQSEVQKVFSAVWEIESQVNNGGFDQYFRNSDSDIIAFAPAALKMIGASACGLIVESAIELVSPLPKTQEERYDALDALNETQQDMLNRLTLSSSNIQMNSPSSCLIMLQSIPRRLVQFRSSCRTLRAPEPREFFSQW